jgi:hypothetical protein
MATSVETSSTYENPFDAFEAHRDRIALLHMEVSGSLTAILTPDPDVIDIAEIEWDQVELELVSILPLVAA